MSRNALLYSKSDMLDAYWAGRNHMREGVKPTSGTGSAFFDWLTERNKRQDVEAKELKDDEMLPSEMLARKYDAPHQRATDDDDDERSRLDSDRLTEHFEREPNEYIPQGEHGYSNPVSI